MTAPSRHMDTLFFKDLLHVVLLRINVLALERKKCQEEMEFHEFLIPEIERCLAGSIHN